MIPLCVPEINGNEWRYIKDCLDTNWVSSAGSYVNSFEDRFSEYIGIEKAVVTMNGTAALELALRALGIGDGDEVIVPSLTFISPVNVVKYVGAEPVFVDVCEDTWVMDTNKIEELISNRTKAILPVHLYGHPVDMDKIMEIAVKYNLYVIEDATESLGSKYKEKHLGTIGHIGCFSFNGNKLITTGAGGMLITNNTEWSDRAKFLSTQTKKVTNNKAFYHPEIGYNYRMPNVLAALGCAQLECIDEYIAKKREHAAYYNSKLKNKYSIVLPVEKDWAYNVFWLYSILIEEDYGISRDDLINEFAKYEIETRPFFMPVHKMPPFLDSKKGDLSITINLSAKGINLPSSVGLTNDQIDIICSIINSF